MAVSPHLDDAVFSVGGTLERLGADTLVVTCFTGSTDPATVTPFGLSTQLDKGLSADVDYMALRREEDRRALAVLGVTGRHLDLLEAPHRGYDSPAELFAGRHDDDAVAGPLADALGPLLADADLVLAPQALGDHVDHQWVGAVVADLVDPGRVAWWRDTPYVLRRPDAAPMEHVAGQELAVDVTAELDRKVAAVRCYVTQVPFQFGTAEAAGPALTGLARDEAARSGAAAPVEVLRAGVRAAEVLAPLGGKRDREPSR
ncbi:PIG-L deacetylase family protein [Actinomycetospora termitidis]|uniref:PIG-L family deacetylase n=1 Tax=Actinomycetospora termitidis TaxID=3053470 RepID=A0ABT7M6Z5_9PSEU|nr:PIG-L family deacetylase [Actinomycetospora sp. Odt1-22]MDL5156318.1 PIG-L family deacetylase [Actinomycetospora sp. Odt1-22]